MYDAAQIVISRTSEKRSAGSLDLFRIRIKSLALPSETLFEYFVSYVVLRDTANNVSTNVTTGTFSTEFRSSRNGRKLP